MNIKTSSLTKTSRNSSLELLRILAMLAIIAHHYVVNSGVTSQFVYDNIPINQYILCIWGMWGKTAINSFILISGYFMCTMKLTLERYVKLLLQILFYSVLSMIIFGLIGYQEFSLKIIFHSIFGLLFNINDGFSASFMVFYAFVPFYNALIEKISEKELLYLVLGLLFVMSFCSTFFFAKTMNEPIWYMTLYFIASYIRLYPKHWNRSLKISIICLISTITLAIVSVVIILLAIDYRDIQVSGLSCHYFVRNSNRILAFLVGFFSFLTFKNLPVFHSNFINAISASAFGVLLIHASCDGMRQWLWGDFLNVPGMYDADSATLIIHMLIAPLIIYMACAFIDYFRRQYIEPIYMNLVFLKRKS